MRSSLAVSRPSAPSIFFLGMSLVLLSGCSSSSPPPDAPPPEAKPAASAAEPDYAAQIGNYMPPLEQGVLEVAAPKDWVWSRAGEDYLVGFHPAGRSLNDLPRILLAVRESPFELQEAVPTNSAEFVQQVTQAAGDRQLRAPPSPISLKGRLWVELVELRKSRNSLVARHVLQTVVQQRLYSVQLEVFDRQLEAYREAAYAVAASFRFNSPGSPSSAAPDAKPDPAAGS